MAARLSLLADSSSSGPPTSIKNSERLINRPANCCGERSFRLQATQLPPLTKWLAGSSWSSRRAEGRIRNHLRAAFMWLLRCQSGSATVQEIREFKDEL